MQVEAHAKYIHMSPRKVRLVVDLIRGLSVSEARVQLQTLKRDAAVKVLKALNSAVANAVNNNGLNAENLIVTKACVNEGMTFYRYRPRARGSSAPVRRRMSHIFIAVGEKGSVESKKNDKAEKKQKDVVTEVKVQKSKKETKGKKPNANRK